jgi:hypothetical protein
MTSLRWRSYAISAALVLYCSALQKHANPAAPILSEKVDKKTKRPRPRISFPVPKSKTLKQEEDDVVNMAVQEERKYAIEAAIVRGMKMNRTMKMTELVHHVIRQLDYLFKAEPKCDRAEPTRQDLLLCLCGMVVCVAAGTSGNVSLT